MFLALKSSENLINLIHVYVPWNAESWKKTVYPWYEFLVIDFKIYSILVVNEKIYKLYLKNFKYTFPN